MLPNVVIHAAGAFVGWSPFRALMRVCGTFDDLPAALRTVAVVRVHLLQMGGQSHPHLTTNMTHFILILQGLCSARKSGKTRTFKQEGK